MTKKMILVTSLALMLATAGTAMAASGNGTGVANGTGVGNGTGQHMAYQGTQDADGDGICDRSGNPVGTGGMGYGADNENFIDADGDGVCDNAGSGGTGAFVDADGDGVCDTGGGTHSQDGAGMRHGGQTV